MQATAIYVIIIMMNIISILHNKIHFIQLASPLFGKKKIVHAAVTIPAENIEQINIDIWASYIRQALSYAGITKFSKQKVEIILGQRFWQYERLEIPLDIPANGVEVFIKNKLHELGFTANEIYAYKAEFVENRGKRYANIYILTNAQFETIQTLLSFYEMMPVHVYPEALMIFQFFEHTLNKQKQEFILYLEHNHDTSYGLVFDSMGLADKKTYYFPSVSVEKELQKFAKDYPAGIARLILGGTKSTEIRQDTFTKQTGMWTNPLNKIITATAQNRIALKYDLNILEYPREVTLLKNFEDKAHALYALPILKGKKIVPMPVAMIAETPAQPPEVALIKTEPIAEPPVIAPSSPFTPPSPVVEQPPEIKPTDTPFIKPIEPPRPRQPFIAIRPDFKKFVVYLFLLLVSLGFSFGATSLFLDKEWVQKIPTFLAVKTISTPTLPPAKPTSAPTPTPAVDKSKLVIEIQNGAGTPGLAADVQEALEGEDYTIESVGNADNYDYENTVIITQNKTIFDLIKKDMVQFGVKKPLYEKTSDDRVTIIIGSDFILP